MNLRGYLLVLLAATLWGSLGPVAKYAFSQGITPLEVAFWRCVLPWPLFALQALRQGNLRVERADRTALAGFSLLCIASFYAVYQLAIQEGGAALASVLMYTAPAWVAIMAWLFLGERMTVIKVTAVASTLIGVAGVSGAFGSAQTTITTTAVIYGLLSGLTYALYYIFGKGRLQKYSTPVLFFYALPIGALILFPLVDFHTKSLGAWMAIGAVSVFSTWAAYSVYYAGLRQLEATRASVVATFEPVVAAGTAYVAWAEVLSPAGYGGAVLILAAVGLIIWDGNRAVALRNISRLAPDA